MPDTDPRLTDNQNARGARLWIGFPALVYIFAIACFIENSYTLTDFPLDDAWIHRVYSQSIAAGHGFQYNKGQQEAGETSPLWAVLTSPAHWLQPLGGESVVLFVKLIGVMLGLVSLYAIGYIARQITDSQIVGCLSASLFAMEPRFLFSALSGMETNLLLALWAGAVATLLAKRRWLSAILFGLTPVARPEAVLILPLSILGSMRPVRKSNRRIANIAVWMIPILPIVLWMAFCLRTTGHLLPNTFYLKARAFQF